MSRHIYSFLSELAKRNNMKIQLCLICMFFRVYSVQGSCDQADRATCGAMPGVCSDPELAATFCPHMCGLCVASTSPAAESCLDQVGNGMSCQQLPRVCASQYAPIVCRRACHFCTPASSLPPPTDDPSTAPWTDTCDDHLVHGLTCASVPQVCADQYGRLFCRRTCQVCSPTTAAAPTTAPRPASSTAATVAPPGGGGNCDLPDHDQCPVMDNVCEDSALSQLLCPHKCGFCPTTSEVTTAPITPHVTVTTTSRPVVETCVDHLGHGLQCQQLPSVCTDPYAEVVCRRTCGFCQPTPGAVTSTPPDSTQSLNGCDDHVTNGLTCAGIPSVCSDAYGQVFCRNYCGNCATTTTTTIHTTMPSAANTIVHTVTQPTTPHINHTTAPTTTPATPAVTTATTSRPVVETCVDNLGLGLLCTQLPGVCTDPCAQVVCRLTCGFCQPTPGAVTLTPPDSTQSLIGCDDHVTNGLTCAGIPSVCSDVYGQVFCRKSCGNCATTTTTTIHTTMPHTLHTITPTVNISANNPTTTHNNLPATPAVTTATTSRPVVETCVDNLGHGLLCTQLPGVCTDPYAQVVCRLTCGFCHPTPGAVTLTPPTSAPSPEGCDDHVTNGLTCAGIPSVCSDLYGQVFCRRYCANCGPETTTTPTPTTEPTNTPTPTATTALTTATTTAATPIVILTATTLPSPTAATTTTPATTSVIITTPTSSNTTAATTTITAPTHRPMTPVSTTTGPTTAPPGGRCVDHIGHGLSCDGVNGACDDPLAPVVCAKTCGYCQCEDKVIGLSCEEIKVIHHIDPCLDQLGHTVCQNYCGFC